MKGRLLPLLATISCLALAAVSPAQRRGGGSSGGGGGSRSSGSPSRSGGESRSTRSSGGDSRPSRSSDSRPSRSPSSDTRSTRSSDSRSSRDDRPSLPRSRNDRSSDPIGRPSGPGDRDSRGRDSRSTERTSPGDRRNIFERETGGQTQDVRRGNDRPFGSGGLGDNGRRVDSGRSVYTRPGRSGTATVGGGGGFHNGYGHAEPVRYGGGYNRSVLGIQVDRNRPRTGYNADYRYGGVYGGLRYGYVGYSGYGDYFSYPFYCYDPWAVAVVASPWYRYSFLPPYLDTNRVTVVNNYNSYYDGGNDWQDYNYRADDRSDRNDELNDALGDIRDAFERNSDRYAQRLLPESGQIAIFNEGKYDYSLGVDDFKDMFFDGIEQSKTARYEIVESKRKGDEVHLRARHTYTDSFGSEQTVYHTYTLRRENGRYVIREFGSS